MADLEQTLIDRLNKNLSDYHKHLSGFGKQEIIDMAERAAAMADVHLYLTDQHNYDAGEIEYLLNFQNPLEVVADAWEERISDLSDLDYVLDDICDKQDALEAGYARADRETGRDVDALKPSIKEQLKAAKDEQARQLKPHGPGKDNGAR